MTLIFARKVIKLGQAELLWLEGAWHTSKMLMMMIYLPSEHNLGTSTESAPKMSMCFFLYRNSLLEHDIQNQLT